MKKRRGQTDRGLSRKSRISFRAAVERFENRLLLTTFFVRNNTDPTPQQVQPDDGSLRGEILAANLPANAPTAGSFNTIDFSMLPTNQDTINIDVPTNGSLPALMAATLLDGSTAVGFKNAPVVEINGGVLILQAAKSEIKDLSIVGNSGSGMLGDGIDLMGGSDTVVGNYIGLNPDGTPDGNTGTGINILSANNIIGAPPDPVTAVRQGNVISNNGTISNANFQKFPGIEIGVGATGNTIAYNYIGTDPTGFKSLGNGTYGIQDDSPGSFGGGINSTNNLIGGQDSNPPGLLGPVGPGNLISGNGFGGIAINSGATNNTLVEGNFIGTDLSGQVRLPNGLSGSGIAVSGARNVTIGGFAANGGGSITSFGNVISGNNGNGVQVTGATATFITIQSNYIGVASDGTSALGNKGSGVIIQAGGADTVGGTDLFRSTKGYGNIIAYNGVNSSPAGFGVEIINSSMDGILTNSIYGNGGLGIKLSQGNSGVQPPTITSAESGGGQTRLTGSYFGFPNTPYLIQFFSNQNSVVGNGQTFVGNLDISTDSTGNFAISITLPTGVPPGNYLTATATELPLTGNNTSQFAVPLQVAVAKLTDLSVVTTVVPPSQGPLLDQPYTYNVTVTNNGPDSATGIAFTDTIPTSSTYVSSTVTGGTGTPSIVGGVLTYDYTNPPFTDPILGMIPADTLPSGASFTVMITVKPTFTIGKFINTASVTGNELDVNQANNMTTTTGTVLPNSFLSVAIESNAIPIPGGSPIAPLGSPITYTLIVSNNGPSASNGTVETLEFNDPTGAPLPPSDVASIVVSPDMGTYSVDTNNVVTINTGILPAGSSSTITINATPTATGEYDATVAVNATTLNSNAANNTAVAPVVVENAADLGVTISSAPALGGVYVLAGQELLYNISVTNNGPSAASAATFTDVLPANVTFDPNDSTAGLIFDPTMGPSGTVTLNIGSLLANTSPIPIVIAVTPLSPGSLTNTVTVGDPTQDPATSVEIDPDLSNNTATTGTLVSPADLQVTIDQPSSSVPLFIGSNFVYQLTVTNNGPADATNVVLNDSIAGGATIISSSPAGQINGNAVSFNLGTLASGASTTIFITVDPTAAGYTGSLIDSATVSTNDEIDPDTTNNNTSTSNPVSPVDVSIVASVSPTTVLVGHSLAYVFTVTNAGPATATDVLFNNTLPSGVVFNSATSTQGSVSLTSAGTVSGDLLTLAPNASASVTIFVTPTAIETATDTATVTPFEIDTNTTNNTASASATVFNLPGTIQLDSSFVSVPENAGSVTLTIDRLGGTLGAVTIDFATSNGTGLAGVNYGATSGTLTFADGQSTATITVPVIDDMVINGDHTFFLNLSNPTNGASLGTPSVATVDVTNTDRDTTPPFVSNLIATTQGNSIIRFTITFDEAMDQARASNVTNYHLFLTNGSTGQTPINIVAAIYNPANDSVTLIPSKALPNNRFYRVVVNGSYGDVLTDTSGNILFGSTGPNTNYDVTYGQGTNLTYTDSHNNSVNLKLTGGGIMQIYRANNGDASTINLIGIVPHKSKIDGSVKKLKKSSSGHTFIGSITGFGQFGNVFSSLKTPAFYVGSAPVSASSVSIPNIVATESTPVTHVTVSLKKTPKGPKFSHK